jgi:DNA polymerase I-like protein with 3'-5' exonuclease and polymerase domains
MTTIAFDTETHGFDWFDGQTAFLASWADADGEYCVPLTDGEGREQFLNLLGEADTVVGHNLSFDTHQTRATTGYDLLEQGKELHDTELMARIAVPTGQARGSYKLKTLAETFISKDAKEAEDAIVEMGKSLGLAMSKMEPGTYYQIWRAYPEVMEHYARMDARYTYDLWARWQQSLCNSGPYQLERRVLPILTRAEATGIRLDPPVVERLRDEYTGLADEAYSDLESTLGATALGGEGSEQALLDSLAELGVPLYRKTDEGKLKTDKFALQEFEDDFPILKTLGDFRRYTKFLSTYIGPMEGRDVVHTSFAQMGAWTSRMSSRRPNMQNIPKRAGKEARSMFIPREDHVFVVLDYESIEVRLLAWYMANEGYRKLIRDGQDPHAYMAAQIHGGAIEDYVKGSPGQPERDVAKNTMFAITYGAGAPRVADMNKITKAEAKALISAIKTSLPGYYKLMRRVRRKIENVGYITTGLGYDLPVNPEKSYVGLNTLIQGTAAGIMKQGLVNVDEVVRPLGATPLLVVHDEVLVECPQENAEECLAVMQPALTEAFQMDPPLSVEGGIVETNYADA